MAIYSGNNKRLKVNLNGVTYNLNLHSAIPVTDGDLLVTSDGFVLRDFNCFYATTIIPIYLISFDDYLLTDASGLYLAVKEET